MRVRSEVLLLPFVINYNLKENRRMNLQLHFPLLNISGSWVPHSAPSNTCISRFSVFSATKRGNTVRVT